MDVGGYPTVRDRRAKAQCRAMEDPRLRRRRPSRPVAVRPASGHAIRGPSFLIWQEERAEAESWARDLLPLRSAPRRVRRRPPGREA